ncbi:hypothetical protein [Agromyces soli]|uniref:Uncharacterized protein n=1 Tax=Agromyces soli TaxID=659012 RepID=A0ABY4B143_9MICO|nr:hypothetical protein [Agromyces soli]UOE26745.1 hypothetical protein MTP13_02900 [Agromyces soli]
MSDAHDAGSGTTAVLGPRTSGAIWIAIVGVLGALVMCYLLALCALSFDEVLTFSGPSGDAQRSAQLEEAQGGVRLAIAACIFVWLMVTGVCIAIAVGTGFRVLRVGLIVGGGLILLSAAAFGLFMMTI